MVIDSLKILLLGMVGIFVIMGIIVLAILILNRFSKKAE